MKKTVIILMIISIISKVLGLLRELVLSYFYGASNISDIYYVSITITTVLFGFIVTAIATSYIPMYRKVEKELNSNHGKLFTNKIASLLIILATIITITGMIFTEELVKIFASGFKGDTFNKTVIFTRISLFSLYFTGLLHLYSGFLQLRGNYIIPSLIGFPLNIVTILFIILSSTINVLLLPIGTVLAILSQLILLFPFLIKQKYKPSFKFNLKDRYIRSTIRISIPVIIGISINEINVIVDRTIASQIAVGGISALSYASVMNNFVLGIILASVSAITYPIISKLAAEKDIIGFKKIIIHSTIFINLLVVPASIGLMVLSEPIVKLLFGRGAFEENAVLMTSSALFFYSIGLIGFCLREILSKAYYALQDTKTPSINAAIAIILNIILNVILSRIMGLDGLALATSISALFGTTLLLINLKRKIGDYGLNRFITSLLKIVIASIIMGIGVKKIYFQFIMLFSDWLALFLSVILGFIIYLILIFILKIDEIKTLKEMILSKLKKIRC